MGYRTVNKCQTLSNTSQMTFFFQKDSVLAYMHCACNTVQLLQRFRLPFPWTMRSNSPELSALLQDLGSHTAAWYELWDKKTEEIKDGIVEFWQCTDAAFEWKMRFTCFPVLPDSAEAQFVWGGTVKRLLIVCFIGNISAKIYQNAFTCVKVGRFLRHSVHYKTAN